jgi:hypothetical protein
MNQVSLNLVAITIFTLVISSLLGPLVHLSPFVPAIAVASILGLGTLDTLTWQGQGSTLLLDWAASLSSDHRARVVRHEAGHFLVAHLLGIPITGYTLSAWEAFRQGQAGLGGVSFDCQELDAELEQSALSAQLVDRFGTVWMAGVAAETLVYGNSEGGADDRQKFRTLWAQLQRPPHEGALKERLSALQAKTLLQENWSIYEALVTAIEQRLPVAECVEAIGQLESSKEGS